MAEILICTDNPKDAQFLSKLLAAEKYKVELVTNTIEAIQKLLNKKFEVVILGIHKEDTEGAEIISTINKIDKNLPIITVTNADSLETQRQIRKERIFYHLTKPIAPQEIKNAIKCAIRKQR